MDKRENQKILIRFFTKLSLMQGEKLNGIHKISNENKIMSYLYSYFYTDSPPPSTSSGFSLSFLKEKRETAVFRTLW